MFPVPNTGSHALLDPIGLTQLLPGHLQSPSSSCRHSLTMVSQTTSQAGLLSFLQAQDDLRRPPDPPPRASTQPSAPASASRLLSRPPGARTSLPAGRPHNKNKADIIKKKAARATSEDGESSTNAGGPSGTGSYVQVNHRRRNNPLSISHLLDSFSDAPPLSTPSGNASRDLSDKGPPRRSPPLPPAGAASVYRKRTAVAAPEGKDLSPNPAKRRRRGWELPSSQERPGHDGDASQAEDEILVSYATTRSPAPGPRASLDAEDGAGRQRKKQPREPDSSRQSNPSPTGGSPSRSDSDDEAPANTQPGPALSKSSSQHQILASQALIASSLFGPHTILDAATFARHLRKTLDKILAQATPEVCNEYRQAIKNVHINFEEAVARARGVDTTASNSSQDGETSERPSPATTPSPARTTRSSQRTRQPRAAPIATLATKPQSATPSSPPLPPTSTMQARSQAATPPARRSRPDQRGPRGPDSSPASDNTTPNEATPEQRVATDETDEDRAEAEGDEVGEDGNEQEVQEAPRDGAGRPTSVGSEGGAEGGAAPSADGQELAKADPPKKTQRKEQDVETMLQQLEQPLLHAAGRALVAALRGGMPRDGADGADGPAGASVSLEEADICVLVQTLLVDMFGPPAQQRIRKALDWFASPAGKAVRVVSGSHHTAEQLEDEGQAQLAELVRHWVQTIKDTEQTKSPAVQVELRHRCVQLVGLWDAVLQQPADERAALEAHLATRGFAKGRFDSRLSSYLSERMGLDKKQFTDTIFLYRPLAVLVSCFGPGILVFLPARLHVAVSRLAPGDDAETPSDRRRSRLERLTFAARALLRGAPALQAVCKQVDETIVQPILRHQAPDSTRLVQPPRVRYGKKSPLPSVFEMLVPTA